MVSAKELIVKPISSKDARRIVKQIHYSGKVVNNSSLHFGIFLNGCCEGVMQFGSSINKKCTINLVDNTGWNEFIELNRMAFSEKLPRNSESRALSVAFRLIKKNYPHIKWVVSFADGTQCGDGTIYRASGFYLVGINKNVHIYNLISGESVADLTYGKSKYAKENNGSGSGSKYLVSIGAKKASGFQLKYIYFLDKSYKERLTVPILPFSKIDEMGAGMYKGIKRSLVKEQQIPSVDSGLTPTATLQTSETTNG